MKTNIENINDTRKKITFSFDAKQIAEENEKVVKDFVRNAKIAGFRPGKAPVNMVTKLYADSIKEQVERSLTSKAIDELNNIKEFDVYAVVDLNKEDKDGEMSLVFTADIYPEVKLPKSLATKVELEATDVKEEEIDNAIEFYRNQRAKYNEVDREIKAGDFIRLAYTGTIDGESVQALAPEMPLYADQKSTWEEAGNKEAPGIQGVVQGIIGMKKGEKKIVSHEFPKDVKNDKIAGKTAQYEVEIFDIREKELPELNEEFFKSFEVDSLEKLREKVKANIEGEKKSNNEVLKRQFAVEQLMEKCDFALPESAVEDERQSILEEMMMRFMSQGASREDIEKNKEALFDSAGKEAEGRAKMRIFLNRVAKANDLKIDNEDMSRMLWQEAMRTRTKPEDLVKQIRKDRARANRLRSDALLQKAINFIAEKVEVVEKKA
ncbi:MAG: trigger factor [Opitutales bacterium]|nr:trigger factor [Opitutales bacterium]